MWYKNCFDLNRFSCCLTCAGIFVSMEGSSVRKIMCSSLSSYMSWSLYPSWKSVWCKVLPGFSSTYSSMFCSTRHSNWDLYNPKGFHFVSKSYFWNLGKRSCFHSTTWSYRGGLCMSFMRRFSTLKRSILVSTGFRSRFIIFMTSQMEHIVCGVYLNIASHSMFVPSTHKGDQVLKPSKFWGLLLGKNLIF